MGMKIIAGRAGSGKTDALYEMIKNRIGNGLNAVLIVPEQYSLQAERDLVERLDEPGLLGAEVLSFSRLVHRILEVEGGLGAKHISDLGKTMLLRKGFEENGEAFGVFKGSFRKQGFIRQLNDFINELKKNGILPHQLLSTAEEISGFELLKGKLRDMAFAYEYMENALEEKYCDTWDLYELAEEKLTESEIYKKTVFYIDGFAGFTGREKSLVKKLLKRSEDVAIALSCDTGENGDSYVFSNTRRTLEELKALAIGEGEKFELKVCESSGDHGELAFLRDRFYSYPTAAYKGKPENIVLFSAKNRFSEIENAAGEILRLADEKNYRYRDIGIICDMSVYGEGIRRIFTDYDIPCFIDQKRAISASAMVRYLMSALDAIKRNMRYEDVFSYLKTGFSDLDRQTVEMLENHVLERGVRGSLWGKPFEAADTELGEAVEQARIKIWKRFSDFKKKIEKAGTIREFVEVLYDFLDSGRVADKAQTFVERLMEEGDYEYASEYSQIWNIMMEIFQQLIEVGGDEKADIETFVEMLKSGIAGYEVGVIPSTIDQVLVGGLKRTRPHRVKALFILGINDRVIPSVVEDAGIMLDEEIRIMQSKGLPVTMDGDTRVDEERFALYSAMARPTDFIWFSYALSDAEGQSLRPSILAARLKKLFPELEEAGDSMGPRPERTFRAPKAAYGHLVDAMRRYIEEHRPMTESEKAMAGWIRESPFFESEFETTSKALFHDNREWKIGRETAALLYGTPLKSSSSRIERYCRCPFQHFVKYGLRPSERKIYELKGPDVGSIFHESVELFTKKVVERGMDWHKLSNEDVDGLMGEAAREAIGGFNGKLLESTDRYKYFADRIERVAKRTAEMAVGHVKKGEFTPAASEIAFGIGKQMPPIAIEMPGGETVNLEGRIDRMDICENQGDFYIKVIDYKSYEKPFKIGDTYYGLQIQLPVYLNAALQDAKAKGMKTIPAGAFYFNMDDPMIEDTGLDSSEMEAELRSRFKMKGVVLRDEKVIRLIDTGLLQGMASEIIPVKLKQDKSPAKGPGSIEKDDFENLLAFSLKVVGDAAKSMLDGEIEAAPFRKGAENACTYCDYSSICQFDKDLSGNRYRNLKALSEKEALEKIEKALQVTAQEKGKGGGNRG